MLKMKSKSKLQSNTSHKPIAVDSKAKIYVPISTAVPHPPQQQSVRQHSDQMLVAELRRANLQLREKEEIYIDKLIKLEEGLEKQHLEFMQLQYLYNQLLSSYKSKEQQICELQQKYRESNRKRDNNQYHPHNSGTFKQQLVLAQSPQFKKQHEQQKQKVQQLEQQIRKWQQNSKELQKNIQKLSIQNTYYRNKDKMNDSRASLNSKVFEELGQWQRQADQEKQDRIKMEYENKFLKSRNQDLDRRVSELEAVITQKQAEVLKLRQNNIALSRQNSQSRLLRSASRSPQKKEDKEGSDRKSETLLKTNKLIDELYEQNKNLKKQLQSIKVNQNLIRSPKNEYFIRQQQFYSFSQDESSNHSSNQSNQHSNAPHLHGIAYHNHHKVSSSVNKQLFIKTSNMYEIKGDSHQHGIGTEPQHDEIQKIPHFAQDNGNTDQSLQELPAELDIDNLILKSQAKEKDKSNSNSKSEQDQNSGGKPKILPL